MSHHRRMRLIDELQEAVDAAEDFERAMARARDAIAVSSAALEGLAKEVAELGNDSAT